MPFCTELWHSELHVFIMFITPSERRCPLPSLLEWETDNALPTVNIALTALVTTTSVLLCYSPRYNANDFSAHIIIFPTCTFCYVWIVNLQLLLVFGVLEPLLHVIFRFPFSSSVLTTIRHHGAGRLSFLPQWFQLELELSTLELGGFTAKI